MRLSREQVASLAVRAVRVTPADAAEAVVTSGDTALTRFAGNRIHQNVAESDTQLTLRAVLGRRTGVATTNRLDDDGMSACAAAAVDAARRSPEDPSFPGLPGGEAHDPVVREHEAAANFDATRRTDAVIEIIEQSRSRGLSAAGTVSRNVFALAVANSLGVVRATESADVRATVLSMHEDGGSGWASWLGRDVSAFSPRAVGEQAAVTAEKSRNAIDLEPGEYTVVLAPEAVADLLDFMGFLGFGAKPFAEGSSFLVERVGATIVDKRISISDDALSADAIGLPFDFEGVPRKRVALIDSGVAREPVTDSYYSAKLGLPNTGHALLAPNSYGPLPLNLSMAVGDMSDSEMIAGVKRGVYVTRFHYVNVEDPMKLVLTGMTRDGTFMIENGALGRPVKNQRFTQDVLEALSNLGGVGSEAVLVGPGAGGSTLVPALLLERWNFTGQTG